jgi:hypothetical protein
VVLVRLLLFLALATIAGAAFFYLFTRDRRYLRFIGQVVRYTILLLAAVMLIFAFERLVVRRAEEQGPRVARGCDRGESAPQAERRSPGDQPA